jgi:DNA-directed RNA polymerase beta' subunit
MKITLLDVEEFSKGLLPVTSMELRTKTGIPTPDGLFSEKIFGLEGSTDREQAKNYSYINLNSYILHPAIFEILKRIERKIIKYLSTEESFSVTPSGELIDDPDGVTGITEFLKVFPKIKFRGGTAIRDSLIKFIKDMYTKKKFFINKIPVIPPKFREMYQDQETKAWDMDALNNIYLVIMRKASQIKSIGKHGTLFDILNYNLQIAVNVHDKFIRTKLSKKSGLIRNQMLGKRVDYSARGVITPGPQLKINEVGIPLRSAVKLFEPFLIHHFLYAKYPYIKQLEYEVKKHTESDLTVDSLKRVIKSIKSGDEVSSELLQLFWDATLVVMKGRVVILKRDPALHDGSYRAFNPVLVWGHTIQLCTLQVGSFNADFDGDQMAIYHPLTDEAQKETRDKMMRGVGSKNSQAVMYEISKEMCLGLYLMTKDSTRKNSPVGVTLDDLNNTTDPYTIVTYRGQKTTMGRAIFNAAFPPSFKFYNDVVTKKVVNKLIPQIIDEYGDEVSINIFSTLERVGFKFATIGASSFTLDMVTIPSAILRMKDKLTNASPDEAQKLIAVMEKMLIEHLKDTGLYDLVMSGAGKGWEQVTQMLIAKGVIADPKGRLLEPIKSSFVDGLSTKEYFNASSAARKGMADRALNTADTGYFTRQLVYLLASVEASPTLRDCKTNRVVSLRVTSDILSRLDGRYYIYGKKLQQFLRNNFKEGDIINLRTPIFCESKKICHTCYGELLKRHKTPYVGILAGSAIGERGTQLVMRTFHTGGAATIVVRDVLQEILDNDPLLSITKDKLSTFLMQEDDKLITEKKCIITIDKDIYEIDDSMQIKNDHIWVNHLIAKIEFDEIIFNIMLDYPVEVKKKNTIDEVDKITLEFNPGDILLEIPMQTHEIKEQVHYIQRLLGGRVIYKDPSHLISKILKIYGGKISDLDLVHFEIMISQVLRDRSNPMYPARLGKTWDPVMANIKTNIFSTSFLQGMAFENINKSIEMGLISKDIEPDSLFERIITGDLEE